MSDSPPVRLIRLRPPQVEFVSARGFERAFEDCCAATATRPEVDAAAGFYARSALLGGARGPTRAAALRADAAEFRAAFADGSVICPDYRLQPLGPLLAALRNISGSRAALCVFAHSPALCALEWALYAHLLTARDAIVAPSGFAATTIVAMAPELAPLVRTIPHAVSTELLDELDRRSRKARPKGHEDALLALTRLAPAKLVHRQIDALAVLRARGRRKLQLHIAGPLADPATGATTAYVGSLRARVRRLGLTEAVAFCGDVRGLGAKADLLMGSRALLNLSVTLEESFGKSVAEARCAGLPIVATHWNGLLETVGEDGVCVPVEHTERFAHLDTDSNTLADAIEAVLDRPRPSRARAASAREQWHPRRIGARYHEMWLTQLSAHAGRSDTQDRLLDPSAGAAPSGGLLAETAPLNVLSFGNLFDLYLDDARACGVDSGMLEAAVAPGGGSVGSVRALLMGATSTRLAALFAHREAAASPHSRAGSAAMPYRASVAEAASAGLHHAAPEDALFACMAAAPPGLVRGAAAMFAEPGLHRVAALARGGDPAGAFELCLRLTRAPLVESAAVVFGAFARLASKLGRPSPCLRRMLAFVTAFPDHPGTLEIALLAAELAAELRGSRDLAARAFRVCQERVDNLAADDNMREALLLRIAGRRMAAAFGGA